METGFTTPPLIPEPIIADLRPRLAELDEAVEQQTATAEYCRSSMLPRDLAPVWDGCSTGDAPVREGGVSSQRA